MAGNDNFLVRGHLLDGKGGATPVGMDIAEKWSPDRSDGVLWLHFDLSRKETGEWLRAKSGLEPIVCLALLADETRPRYFETSDGMVVILRGVNLNPGANPHDMISIRIWIEKNRIITIRPRHLKAVEDMRKKLEDGRGPTTAGGFVAEISLLLVNRMSPVLVALDDKLDQLEHELIEEKQERLRKDLGELRRQVIRLRRYLSPQRETMLRMYMDQSPMLFDRHQFKLRESYDRVARYVEDMDAIRDRAALIQDELTTRISANMNRNMYLLSLVASLFLPLGFITGLLGVNMAGMPGTDNAWAFWELCLVLSALLLVEYILLRKLKWI